MDDGLTGDADKLDAPASAPVAFHDTKYGAADEHDFGSDGRPCWDCDHGIRADEFCWDCARCRVANCINLAASNGECGEYACGTGSGTDG